MHALTNRPRVALAALFAVLTLATVTWVTIDRRPPESDHANHLERALKCHRNLAEGGEGRWRAILEESSFYPPVVPCAAGLLYFVAPVTPMTAQVVMLIALAVALAAIFAIGHRLLGPPAGLLAALMFGTAPFVVFSLNNFQLDLPLAAAVAVALYCLLRTDAFSNVRWTVVLGIALGLGMLTKPTFAAYVLPPMLWPLARAWRAPDRRLRAARLAAAIAIAAVLALPWYGPRLAGLPMQAANRSFKQAAEAGQVEAYTPAGLMFYPRVFQPQFGMLAGLLCVWGLWAIRRRPGARAVLWLAVLVPLVMFSLIQNKNLRYTLPILPAAALLAAAGVQALRPGWRRPVIWACVAIGALQISMADFALPRPPVLPPWLTPAVVYFPPSRADWQLGRVLDDLAHASGGSTATVSVVPNYNFFSVSNFRYEALKRRLPLQMTRAITGPPLGIDFVVLKTGSQGPAFTTGKADRATAAFTRDRYLAETFPVIREYPLPDGSTGILRQRRIAPVQDIAPAEIARRLRELPDAALADYARDVRDRRVRIDYRPETILAGEVDHVRVEVESVVVGEHARRDRAPLRVRELKIEVDRLLIDPRRLVETGALEVLDAGALRLEHAVVTQADLDEFLRGQPPAAGMQIRLADGAAVLVYTRFGAGARLALTPGVGGAPFGITVDDLRIARVPVPAALVNWIARNFDPTLRLRSLPVDVTVAPIRIAPGKIQIGEPG